MKDIKLNIGSGNHKYEGFLNVDIQDWNGNTDIKHDLIQVPYPFEENSVSEIISLEFLEHISFHHTFKVLTEWKRILKDGGKAIIQVPDCGQAMEYYVNNEICNCVPHKGKSLEDFKADKNCFNCQGKAKINPVRWLYSFTGAQKHFYDSHLNIFTQERMEEILKKVGFRKIEFKEHPFKLIVEVIK